MAHELEIAEDGTVSMAYTGELPWHGLGKRVPADLSPEQMLKAANLDWTVDRKPLFFNDEQGNRILTSSTALVRSSDNKVLTVVSDKWNPVQNIEAFEFFNDFVNAGEMEMHTAGSLKGGKVVWALAKIKDSFELFGGDKVEGYLLFSNPHEFGRSIDIRFTPIRVVCNNTLGFAMDEVENGHNKNFIRISHRSMFDEAKVKAQLGIAATSWQQFMQSVETWSLTPVSPERAKEYFDKISSYQNTQGDTIISHRTSDKLMELFNGNGKGAKLKSANGTAWGLVNAVTEYVDHHRGRSDDVRMDRAWFGDGVATKELAKQLADEIAFA